MKTPVVDRLFCIFRASIALVLGSVFVTGCTSLQQIPSSDLSRLTSVVKAGDQLVCNLRDGSVIELKVSTVEADVLVAEGGRRIAVADIASVRVKRPDMTKSVLLGVGAVAVIVIAIAAGGGGGGGGGGY
jgi:hypothetical protein